MPKEYALQYLMDRNEQWLAQMKLTKPQFFTTVASKNQPKYMWIGCSDSRVVPTDIIGLYPGEIFVHRNVGNVMVNSDLNSLSAVQFAVDHLNIEHIILVGHYDCAAVKAALSEVRIGVADNWIRHIQAIRDLHEKFLHNTEPQKRKDALAELNVVEQLVSVAKSTVVQDAWLRGQNLALHGWVYDVTDGRLINLQITIDCIDSIKEQRYRAIAEIRKRYLLSNEQ